MTAPFDLYFWPTPNGYKVSIMLEELGAEYALIPVNITKGEQHSEAFSQVSANHKIPALTHRVESSAAPVSLFESGAILWYLGEWSGQLIPVDAVRRRECMVWLMWQMGGLGPMAGQAHHFLQYASEDIPYAKQRYQMECERLYGVLDRALSDRAFIAEEYSVADIAILAWVYRHERHQVDLAQYPSVQRWYQTLMAREPVKRGFEVGQSLIQQSDFKSDVARAALFGQALDNANT